jgi:very-short-patch-repair endonuclease
VAKVTHQDIVKFKKWKFAKQLRHTPTEGELKVWAQLRLINYQLPKGCVWRRQGVVGRYVVDFLCERSKIGLEVDGSSHRGKEVYDAHRQFLLNNLDVNDTALLDGFVKALMVKTLLRLDKYNR